MTDGNEADPDAAEATAPAEGRRHDGAADPDETAATANGASSGGREPTAREPAGPPEGFVRLRVALVGVGLLWLAAVAAIGALLAAVYGSRTAPSYLALAVAAATLSVGAGYASLRTFGFA